MRCRWGQVKHKIDIGRVKKLLDSARWKAELLGARLRCLGIDIRHRGDAIAPKHGRKP